MPSRWQELQLQADINLDHKDSKSLCANLLSFTYDKLCMDEGCFDCTEDMSHRPGSMECLWLHELDSPCRDITKVEDCQFQQQLLPIIITCLRYRQLLFAKTLQYFHCLIRHHQELVVYCILSINCHCCWKCLKSRMSGSVYCLFCNNFHYVMEACKME